MRVLSCRIGRNNGLGAAPLEPLAKPSRIVGPVRDQPTWCGNERQQVKGTVEVMGIARRQRKGNGPASRIGQGVDLGRAPAARAANGLREGPPFAPAAERCALMWVLSTAAEPIQLPVEPVSAKNISRQIPCRLQRLKRL